MVFRGDVEKKAIKFWGGLKKEKGRVQESLERDKSGWV